MLLIDPEWIKANLIAASRRTKIKSKVEMKVRRLLTEIYDDISKRDFRSFVLL